MLVSHETGIELHSSSHEIYKSIRPQAEVTIATQMANLTSVATATATRYLLLAGFVFSYFGAGDQVLFFIFIRSLSMIVHLQLFNLKLPPTITNFLGNLVTIVMFDYLDVVNLKQFSWYNSLFDYERQNTVQIQLSN